MDFRMKVVRRHQTALFRQVHEAVRLHRISKNPGVKILNSKGEYNRCNLPRLQVQGPEEFKDPKEQESGGAKYTLQGKQKNVKPNESKVFRNRKDKSKVKDSSNDDGNQVNFQSNSNLNDIQVDNTNNTAAPQQTESKPNISVEAIEVKQPRRVYKYVASNFRFKKKFDIEQ